MFRSARCSGECLRRSLFLRGVATEDAQEVGGLLGSKLAINEHSAYLQMKGWKEIPDYMSPRS